MHDLLLFAVLHEFSIGFFGDLINQEFVGGGVADDAFAVFGFTCAKGDAAEIGVVLEVGDFDGES